MLSTSHHITSHLIRSCPPLSSPSSQPLLVLLLTPSFLCASGLTVPLTLPLVVRLGGVLPPSSPSPISLTTLVALVLGLAPPAAAAGAALLVVLVGGGGGDETTSSASSASSTTAGASNAPGMWSSLAEAALGLVVARVARVAAGLAAAARVEARVGAGAGGGGGGAALDSWDAVRRWEDRVGLGGGGGEGERVSSTACG